MPPASSKNPTYSPYDEENAADAPSTRADYTTITVTWTETQYVYPSATAAPPAKQPSPPTMLNHFDWPQPLGSRKQGHATSRKRSEATSAQTSAEDKSTQGSVSQPMRAAAISKHNALHSLPVSAQPQYKQAPLSTLSTHILPSNTLPSVTATTMSATQKSTSLAPRATTHHTHNAATLRYRHPSLIGHSNMGEFDLPPMPASLQIVLYVGIALGSLWVLAVWLVNFPPHVWVEAGDADADAKEKAKKKRKKKKEKEKEEDRKQSKWWDCTLPGLQQAARAWAREGKKPVDKPNKYVSVPSASTSLDSSTDSTASASSGHSQGSSAPALVNGLATTSATPTRAGHGDEEDAVSVRKRRPPQSPGQEQGQELAELQRRRLSASPTIPPWQRDLPQLQRHDRPVQQQPQPLPRSRHTNGAMTAPPSPGIHVTPSPAPPSPENPYLPPPSIHPRSSNEYLAAHRAFFNSKPPTPPLCSPSSPHSLSASASLSNFSYEDIDALEAQTALPSHRRSKSEVHLTPNGYGGYGVSRMKKRWSGVNVLEAVDGAVSWGVDKMVKWTDDAGDEELLLPLVGSKARKAE